MTEPNAVGSRYLLVGDLTLHGVTSEIVLDATLNGLNTDPFGGDEVKISVDSEIVAKPRVVCHL